MEELAKYLRALLLLDIHRTQKLAQSADSLLRIELLLSDAGFSHQEIAGLVGKKVPAVSKAISRARAVRPQGLDDADTNGEKGDSND
jgi:DNA-directed RNA polymerase specialized sigma24 family protein